MAATTPTRMASRTLALLMTLVLGGIGATQEKAAPRRDLYGDPLPAGAVSRLGTIRMRHEQVNGLLIAVAPNGKTIATTGRTGVRLWDAATGKLLRQIDNTDENHLLGPLVFSADGRWLVIGGFGATCIFDPATGKLAHRLPGAAQLLALSPDGKLLGRSEGEGILGLWETDTGRRVCALAGPPQLILVGAFTADGKTLITFSFGKKLCHWDVATGALKQAFDLDLPLIRTWALSVDGRTLAVAPYSREAVQLWDGMTGKLRGKLRDEPAGSRYPPAFTSDGRTLATNWIEDGAVEGQVSLWDAETGRLRRRFTVPGRGATYLGFAPDSRTLLSSGGGPGIFLWDTATGRRLLRQDTHDDTVNYLVFTPDGQGLVTGSHDGTIRQWDRATAQSTRCLEAHRSGVTRLALAPGGMLVSAGYDGTVRQWDIVAGREVRAAGVVEERPGRRPSQYQVWNLAVSADGRRVTSISFYTSPEEKDYPRALLHRWDLATGKTLLRRPVSERHVPDEAFAPDAQSYLSYEDPPPPETKEDANQFVGGRSRVALHDVATGERRLALPLPDVNGCRHAFSPDGRLLITTTYIMAAYTLRLWELARGQERLAITTSRHGFIEELIVAPGGNLLAAARNDRTLQIWDLWTGQELFQRGGFDAPARSLAFAPDERVLASGHADSTVLLWDRLPSGAAKAVVAEMGEVEAWWDDLASADAHKAHRKHGRR